MTTINAFNPVAFAAAKPATPKAQLAAQAVDTFKPRFGSQPQDKTYLVALKDVTGMVSIQEKTAELAKSVKEWLVKEGGHSEKEERVKALKSIGVITVKLPTSQLEAFKARFGSEIDSLEEDREIYL